MAIINLYLSSVQYSMLLIVVFLLEFLVGAVTYVYESQVDDELLATLNKTFITNYGIDETRTTAIDLMQQNVRLCFFLSFLKQIKIWIFCFSF